jgi:hypothetical protein
MVLRDRQGMSIPGDPRASLALSTRKGSSFVVLPPVVKNFNISIRGRIAAGYGKPLILCSTLFYLSSNLSIALEGIEQSRNGKSDERILHFMNIGADSG